MRLTLALAPLVLAACSFVSDSTGASSLQGTTWTATALPGASGPVVVPDGQTLSVTFGAKGQLTGQADCNRMSGGYTAGSSAALAVSGVGQTRMFCGQSSLGDAFARALEASQSYAIAGNTLTIHTDAGGTIRLKR